MIIEPTPEQSDIINAPLGSQCVIACAGSGKTATAVRRLAVIRQRLGTASGRVALLSYSNTAVDTFRLEYTRLASAIDGLNATRVHISTVDSFIVSQLLLPHAARLMGCHRRPFLVHGYEPFLKGHTVFNGEHGVPISALRVAIGHDGLPHFSAKLGHGAPKNIPLQAAVNAIAKLSRAGAYTYDTGRYLAWRVLREDGRLGDIVCRRFSHILVDEAQDIGSMHGAILTDLRKLGVTLTLIGDPRQAIFEFADADGSFLKGFADEVGPLLLSLNRRSVAAIVAVANLVCGASDLHFREAPSRPHGAFMFTYDPKALVTLPSVLQATLSAAGYSTAEAVILCRGRALLEKLNGGASAQGCGVTERFALAAMMRDKGGDAIDAFGHLVDGLSALLEGTAWAFRSELTSGPSTPTTAALRRLLWRFFRDPVAGLPSSSLPAKAVWQPKLKARLVGLLDSVSDVSGYTIASTWRKKITVADLPDTPLVTIVPDTSQHTTLTVKTVHDVKGDGFDAVIYLAKKGDLESLVNGPSTEDGRIGYVAITRAKDLLLIGVPQGLHDLAAALAAKGVQAWTLPN